MRRKEKTVEPLRRQGAKVFLLDRIYWIVGIIFLYLKFPEEISNEQSATPKRETLVGTRWRGRLVVYTAPPLELHDQLLGN